jgi:uncharacterized protein
MIIDCHYHLQTKLLTINELIQKMDESGVEKVALMGVPIDPFPEPPKPLISLLQVLITHRSTRSLAKMLISNFTDDGIKILGKNMPIYRDPDNQAVFNAVDQYPDRFLGWVFVNPKGKKEPVKEFEKYINHKGFIGVKAHPFWNHHTPLDLAPVAKRLAETGKPMLIHAGYGEEGNFDALLKEAPNLKLILAHAGFPLYADTWQVIAGRKNIFVDLSQTTYVNEKIMKNAVAALGPDQCLFGTDGPYGFHGEDGKFDYGLMKRRIEKLFIDQGLQKRLLGENFAEIAGL